MSDYGEMVSDLYAAGVLPANYLLPSVLGYVDLDACMVCLAASDANRPNPLVTWYSQALGLPLPPDHGKIEEWN